MANRTEHRGDTERRRTPLASAAILLGLYVGPCISPLRAS